MHPDIQPAKVLRYADPAAMSAAYPEPNLHYEHGGVILLEQCGIGFDDEFVSTIRFPAQWKKIGTANDITVPPIVYHDGKYMRTQNPLCGAIADDRILLKVYSELLRIELGFKLLVANVLPSYRNITWQNCTFRFTKTGVEPAHLDSFDGGQPLPEKFHVPRLKIFLNIDSQPRVWNVGPTLPDLLRHSEGKLGSPLPTDLNVLCARINESGVLKDVPMERVEIPPRGVIFANGATVLHQVVYGNRMVCLEGFVPKACLQLTSMCEWDQVADWIRTAGYVATHLVA
jgi:hypothetical protein